jgi:hypothetical protein
MLIKDLSVSKELDCKEMAAVHGGYNANSSIQGNQISQGSQTVLGLANGVGSPTVGVYAPVAVGTNTNTTAQLDFSSFSFPGLRK